MESNIKICSYFVMSTKLYRKRKVGTSIFTVNFILFYRTRYEQCGSKAVFP